MSAIKCHFIRIQNVFSWDLQHSFIWHLVWAERRLHTNFCRTMSFSVACTCVTGTFQPGHSFANCSCSWNKWMLFEFRSSFHLSKPIVVLTLVSSWNEESLGKWELGPHTFSFGLQWSGCFVEDTWDTARSPQKSVLICVEAFAVLLRSEGGGTVHEIVNDGRVIHFSTSLSDAQPKNGLWTCNQRAFNGVEKRPHDHKESSKSKISPHLQWRNALSWTDSKQVECNLSSLWITLMNSCTMK